MTINQHVLPSIIAGVGENAIHTLMQKKIYSFDFLLNGDNQNRWAPVLLHDMQKWAEEQDKEQASVRDLFPNLTAEEELSLEAQTVDNR